MKASVPPSVKGKSRSAYNTLANTTNLPQNNDGTIKSLKNGRKPGQLNREYTRGVEDRTIKCHVQFTLFCCRGSYKWYLAAPYIVMVNAK